MEITHGAGRPSVPREPAPGEPSPAHHVAQLVAEFNSASDSDALVRLVLERAVLETRSDRGVICWIDGSEMVVAGCHDPHGELVAVGSRWPLASEQVTAIALASGQPETGSLDTSAIELTNISPALRDTYAALRHLLVAPVSVAGKDVAILCVSRRRSEAFTDADTRALGVVAQTAAQPLRAGRLDDMLGAALTQLGERIVGIDSVERVKTDLLRLASHELRSPLTVLHGYLALVRGGFFGDIPDALDRVMEILARRTTEMNALVNGMLVAARVEDVSSTLREPADLRLLLREAVASVAPRAPAQHRFHVETGPDPIIARVDTERIMLALHNLIDNAVKYSPAGGDVICCVSSDGATAHFRVADSGLGIAPGDRAKLFTRFGRVLTSANSHIPGIGLGLYFAREVARHHGGDVALVDGDGSGSVFDMTLPLEP